MGLALRLRPLAWLLPVLAACAAALPATARADARFGSLTQLSGAQACFMDIHGWSWIHCPSSADGLSGAMTSVVSPDGKNVYVASYIGDAVSSFSRDPATGNLAPLPGAAACMKDRAADAPTACTTIADGIDGAISVAISPDGANVYVAGEDESAIAAFSRDPQTGVLTQLPSPNSCIKDSAEPATVNCPRTAEGLHGIRWVTVSPDGKNVYTTAPSGHSIAAFSRDPQTGALTQLPGAAACIEDPGDNSATSGLPNGTFKSNCQQTANGLAYPRMVTVSPDGKNAYAADDWADAVSEFSRDPQTGALTPLPGADACIKDEVNAPSYSHCPSVSHSINGAFSVTISPDGKNAYVPGDAGDDISVFARDATTGALHQLSGAGACVKEWNAPVSTQCPVIGNGLHGAEAVSVSRDGLSAYVTAFHGRAIAEFDRDPASGAVTQLPGADACVEDVRAPVDTHCPTVVNGIEQPRMLALSPDGKSGYAPASVGDTLALFRRAATVPQGWTPPSPCGADHCAPVIPPPPVDAAGSQGTDSTQPGVAPPRGAGSAQRPGAPGAGIAATIYSRALRLSSRTGSVTVVIANRGGRPVRGRAVLAPRWSGRSLSRRFRAAGGATISVKITLSRGWRRRLARRGALPVRLLVTVGGAADQVVAKPVLLRLKTR